MRCGTVHHDFGRLPVADAQAGAQRPDVGLVLVGDAPAERHRCRTVTGQLEATHQPPEGLPIGSGGLPHRADNEPATGVIPRAKVPVDRIRALLSKLRPKPSIG
ncbi:MAG: hypothetical protein NVSMB60_25890 [Mycobacterium sp.]